AVLEGGGVDKRLEGRAGLAFRLRRAIEATLVEVAAADHCPDRTAGRVQRYERALQVLGEGLPLLRAVLQMPCGSARASGMRVAATMLDARQTSLEHFLGGLLQSGIERRVDPKAALRE